MNLAGNIIIPYLFLKIELKDAFDMFDKNGSGEIDESELKNVVKKLGIDLSDKELHVLGKLF